MGSRITKQAEKYLEVLVSNLEVSPTRYEQAETSYKSLGEWLHRDESSVQSFDPDVFVQGSFKLGTVVKPASKDEEYDIDATCVLNKLSSSDLTQQELKSMLGVELELYRKSKGMTKELKEGRRCWTLEYSDSAQFHMDLVPAIPNRGYQRLLEKQGLNASFASSAITITDNEVLPAYYEYTHDWPRSNPAGYAEWFKHRMGSAYIAQRNKILAEMQTDRITASVEEVPEYKIRTPLQSAIMILKRHRDTMYANDNENKKPISIIITTLAAHSYQGEETIGQALTSVLTRMEDAIEWQDQKYVIRNPADARENFADKWEENPERATAFFEWLGVAREEFYAASLLVENQQISKTLASNMGADLVESVNHSFIKEQGSSRLLRNATTASTLSSSFGDTPRVPSKPAGFA